MFLGVKNVDRKACGKSGRKEIKTSFQAYCCPYSSKPLSKDECQASFASRKISMSISINFFTDHIYFFKSRCSVTVQLQR